MGGGTDAVSLADDVGDFGHSVSTFRDVGAALLAIRDSKHYRDEHKTFEAYCQDRWKLKRQRAYELIDAAPAAEDVGNFRHARAKESHAAPLASLPKAARVRAWEEVIERAPKDGAGIVWAGRQ